MEEKKIRFEIKKVANMLKRQFETALAEEDMTGNHSYILGYIIKNGENGGVYQKDIEKEFNIRRSTVTGVLNRMEKNRLIKRVVCENRKNKIILTQKGKDYETLTLKKLLDVEEKIKEGISQKDLETFFKVLSKIEENLE